MIKRANRGSGFTIVELLIVIVVIAILAAITVVAYNGIKQRATNNTRVSTVSQLVKLIQGYTATYGVAPSTASVCATQDNACTNNSGGINSGDNTALMTELKKVGIPPQSLQPPVVDSYGIQYIYEPTATLNGTPAPIRLEFWLEGNATPCGLSNLSSSSATGVTPVAGYTITSGNKTTCWLRLAI